ncbi:MAG TPA: hypothetical protein DDW49_01820 [Deltaproteobacteria bacterium]|nr:MAG: hypothetical protein A2048_06960 [Deltaproteobacteria bacterium GWA2_45_12]HBF12121.1 hypothetical protein [Deltaproteobacteria bacterium]
MGEFDSVQACSCYQGRYTPYSEEGFQQNIVNAARFNGGAIRDCYAEDIPKIDSLLAAEKAKALKALRANWFYQTAQSEKQGEITASINQAFTPDQNASALEQNTSDIIELASQRGTGIRRCIGRNKESLEAAYQSAAQASLAFDKRPTEITTPLRTILIEIMAGRLPASYKAYEAHSMGNVLGTAYENNLLIRKAYASTPDRRDELLAMEKDHVNAVVVEESYHLLPTDPEKRQLAQDQLNLVLDSIFWIVPGKDPTRSVTGYKAHSLEERDARDILSQTLSNARFINQIKDPTKRKQVLEIEEKNTFVLAAIRSLPIDPETIRDFAEGRKKKADLPPADPEAHREVGLFDILSAGWTTGWTIAKGSASIYCSMVVGPTSLALAPAFRQDPITTTVKACTWWW